MSFTDYQVHLWLAAQDKYWVSLHFDDPVHAGAYASELSGDGYVRQQASYTSPANRTMWNQNNMQFAGLPACVITHMGGWDAKTKGNLRWSIELPDPKRIIQGGGFTIVQGQLALSFA
jgi:hypothetical protein